MQALPKHGYTAFINNILDHPNIEVRTGVDYFAEQHALKAGSAVEKVFYTGPIDRCVGCRGAGDMGAAHVHTLAAGTLAGAAATATASSSCSVSLCPCSDSV